MNRHKILIVDDEERNIKLLKAMLMADDYQCFWAVNGNEALEAVNDINPDLILLDVMMPGINGYEVCFRLKGNEKTRMIPIIMVTALKEKEDRICSTKSGADDFISKPVDRTELLTRVKSLLRIKSYHDDLVESYRELAEKNVKLQDLEKIKDQGDDSNLLKESQQKKLIKIDKFILQSDLQIISNNPKKTYFKNKLQITIS